VIVKKYIYLDINLLLFMSFLSFACRVWPDSSSIPGAIPAAPSTMEQIEARAGQGNAQAEFILGASYMLGHGIQKNEVEGVKWLQMAADQGNANAENNLGNCYFNGQGVEQDYTQAAEWYRKAADQGDIVAENALGGRYYLGQGVEQDYAQAVEWFSKAADQGNVFAENNLGNCYFNGQGVEKDYVQAADWYRKAVAQGDADGETNLGNCYLLGQGVEKDLAQARFLFQTAIDHGNVRAKTFLESLTRQQNISPDRSAPTTSSKNSYIKLGSAAFDRRDFDAAWAYFSNSGSISDPEALDDMANMYSRGSGVPMDLTKAAQCLIALASSGDSEELYRIGLDLEYGDIFKKNLPLALDFFRAAEKRDSKDAEKVKVFNTLQKYLTAMSAVQIANTFRHHNGQEDAALYWCSAAVQNAPVQDEDKNNSRLCGPLSEIGEAANYIGLYCIRKDVRYQGLAALQWFQRASYLDFCDAENNLGYFYLHGIGVEKNPAQALQYFSQAADCGSIPALVNRGYCFEFGIGTPASLSRADSDYTLAAQKGDLIAGVAARRVQKKERSRIIIWSIALGVILIPIGYFLWKGFFAPPIETGDDLARRKFRYQPVILLLVFILFYSLVTILIKSGKLI
jgi:TPR repeat protein